MIIFSKCKRFGKAKSLPSYMGNPLFYYNTLLYFTLRLQLTFFKFLCLLTCILIRLKLSPVNYVELFHGQHDVINHSLFAICYLFSLSHRLDFSILQE